MTKIRFASNVLPNKDFDPTSRKEGIIQNQVQTSVNGVPYSLHLHSPYPKDTSNNRDLSLLTVLLHNERLYSLQDLQAFLDRARDHDDVFQFSFLRNVVFLSNTNKPMHLGEGVEELLHSLENRQIDFLTANDIAPGTLPSGPYVIYQGLVWQPWRMYQDTQSAFMVTLRPAYRSESPTVADVPMAKPYTGILAASRLYTDQSDKLPLAGVRVAVKDVFDVAGMKTTLSSKAYEELYPEKTRTAPAITKLIHKGAILVGKTRLNSLISKEDPTEAVDYAAPFNSRGDGYQSPAGSSSGSAAAIGAYDWLDLAVGTDTNGSGRIPAIVNGCFSLRMTHDILNNEGLVPSFSLFDAPCLFTRSLGMLQRATEAWTEVKSSQVSAGLQFFPSRVIWLTDFLKVTSPSQMKLIESFVSDLELTFGVTRTPMSLSALWAAKPPKEAGTDSLEDFMREPGWMPIFYDAYHNYDTFRYDYQKRFDKKPYVTPYNRWKWSVGESVTPEQRDRGIARLTIYKTWLMEEVFTTTDTNTILILSVDDGQPKYRDQQPTPGEFRNAYSPLYVSPVLGAPELSIPIGELSYKSVISGRTEQRPIGLSLVAAPGHDVALVESVHRVFQHSGRPLEVLTGSRMYDTQPL